MVMTRAGGWWSELGEFRLLGRPRKGDNSDPLNASANQYIFTVEDAENIEVVFNLWDCIESDAQKRWEENTEVVQLYNFASRDALCRQNGSGCVEKRYRMMNFFSPEDADRLYNRDLQVEHQKPILERQNLEIDVAMIICRIRVEWLDDGGKIASSQMRKYSRFLHSDTVQGNSDDKREEQFRQFNAGKRAIESYLKAWEHDDPHNPENEFYVWIHPDDLENSMKETLEMWYYAQDKVVTVEVNEEETEESE